MENAKIVFDYTSNAISIRPKNYLETQTDHCYHQSPARTLETQIYTIKPS